MTFSPEGFTTQVAFEILEWILINSEMAPRIVFLPRSWRICDIGAVCSLVVDCPQYHPIFRGEGTLVARTTNIRDGRFNLQGASYVDEKEYLARIVRAEPRAGDLIFTREAPVGEAFVVPTWMRICLDNGSCSYVQIQDHRGRHAFPDIFRFRQRKNQRSDSGYYQPASQCRRSPQVP